MDNKFKGFKDVLEGVLQFTKKMIAQITAQLVTAQVLELAQVGFSAWGGGGGSLAGKAFNLDGTPIKLKRFATGGSFMVGGFGGTDTQPVRFLATPGERVTVETPEQQRRGGGATVINITVNTSGGGSKESSSAASPNMAQLANELGKLVEAKLIEEQRPGGLLAGGRG